VIYELFDRREQACRAETFFLDVEPALDLVEPGNPHRSEANAIMAARTRARTSATDRPCNMQKQGVRKVHWTSNIF
jgi:hypothetical protein